MQSLCLKIGGMQCEGCAATIRALIEREPGVRIENIEAHLALQKSLEEQGIMFAAGPQWTDDEKSWEGDGMVVIRANSLAEARAIAEKDPPAARANSP